MDDRELDERLRNIEAAVIAVAEKVGVDFGDEETAETEDLGKEPEKGQRIHARPRASG